MALTISEVKIANMALSNIGTRSTIESLDEDSPEAQQCKLHFDYARAVALSDYDWSFARKRQALAAHSEAPPEDIWDYRYQYPSDCLVARKIENPLGDDADAVPFEVEMESDSKSILTDEEDAVLVYTFNQETPDFFTPYFVRTLSFMLAHLIAYPLTGKQSLQSDMLNTYRFFIAHAEASDANEKVAKPPRDAEWIRDRD